MVHARGRRSAPVRAQPAVARAPGRRSARLAHRPGSDGRGAPKEEPQSRFNLPRPGWRFLLVVVALFALNAFLASKVPDRDARIRIPYNPTFLNQLEAGNVREMVSTGDAIQGDFKAKVTYPPSGQDGSRSSTRFETQLPAFVSGERLEDLVESKGVVLNAKPPEEGRSLLVTAPALLRADAAVRRALHLLAARAAAGGRRARRADALRPLAREALRGRAGSA